MRVSLAFRLETPKRRSHILAEFEVLIVSVRQIPWIREPDRSLSERP
jgi:hypothetical protein